MRTDDFDFELPRSLIAQEPASPRDSARLLDIGERLADRHVSDLPSLLAAGDLLLVNDTRVIPARLRGKRGAAAVEITLHRRLRDGLWRAFAKPARRLKPGDRIEFGPGFHAEVAEKGDGGEITVVPNLTGESFAEALRDFGAVPLPPYIHRPGGPAADDEDRYQTVYARHDGAVAAPTAGLHFTDRLFERLDAAGVRRAAVTLHVGAGTFLPVTAEQAADHRMHPEWGTVSQATADAVNAARAAGGRIVAVGSTSLRLIESAAAPDGRVAPFEGETSLFILPGYRFRVPDLLVTNFHLPRSTLFMLVSAFAGLTRMKAAYAHAIREGYRFYSYGDACLLHRRDGGASGAP
jgi:S-adenosylmethionine:tRNA ribosyltransferase-isomerase